MKPFVCAFCFAFASILSAATIAQWDFNSVPPDSDNDTGTLVPSAGGGTVSLAGGTTNSFAGGHSIDPATSDNSGVNMGNYPPQAQANKQGGVQFAASTAGFDNITVSFAMRVSGTGSKYSRLQYTTDGVNFLDADVIAVAAHDTFYQFAANLAGRAGTANNPSFAIRLVTEFESTAAGTPNHVYVPANANGTYGTGGRIRFDMMTISGDPLGANSRPSISPIGVQSTVAGTPAMVAFQIGDPETAAGGLTLAGSSSNPSVLPDANISFTRDGSNIVATLAPVAGRSGNTVVGITVSDGEFITNQVFGLMVVPSAGVLLYDPFTYENGPLTTNSGMIWTTHSGPTGQLQVENGALSLSAENSEDVNARLRGEPFAAEAGGVLYASLAFAVTALPHAVGEYFAHFRDSSSGFRGRILVGTTNAAAGSYRVAVANSAGSLANATEVPVDLALNTLNRAVLRYDVTSATTTIWLNPINESSGSFTATDPASPLAITSFAFRQNDNIGAIRVDEVRVGLTFNDVLPGGTGGPSAALRITRAGTQIRISWPISAAGYRLQSVNSLPGSAGSWQDVPGTPAVEDGEHTLLVDATGGQRYFRLVQ